MIYCVQNSRKRKQNYKTIKSRQRRKLEGGKLGGAIQSQNFKYCLTVGLKIIVELQKVSN